MEYPSAVVSRDDDTHVRGGFEARIAHGVSDSGGRQLIYSGIRSGSRGVFTPAATFDVDLALNIVRLNFTGYVFVFQLRVFI
jgi:hypothetical protein